MSPNIFQERVTVIGTGTFTFFQTIPNAFVWILAVQEVIRSAPNVGVGVVVALLACLPFWYHVLWLEVLAYVEDDEQRSSGSVDNGSIVV
ncbi:hypothetical protein BDZ89DRAFT_1079437 [Hymenopellis radicata]|nr:hypothetical protein BDZ89DRAFT_1079437 [Hymenopellis radicata]